MNDVQTVQGLIKQLVNDTMQLISNADSESVLSDIKVKALGKSGQLTNILKGLKDIDANDRPAIGAVVNKAREQLEKQFNVYESKLHIESVNLKLKQDRYDYTLNKETHVLGTMHPLNVVKNRIVEFFVGLGFSLQDSPEIETEYYNFTALNVPSDHPARDMQDTFWLGDDLLLRSQTSNGQVRVMQNTEPPIRMLSPGRVYRADDIDATHSPCFHQIEGLVIDIGISMSDLKGVLSLFLKEFFGQDTKTRFRPSFFPFTEPSVEVDASCPYCQSGCRICKGSGWIEILGAGMVHQKVLANCKIDYNKYTGFAFGMGLERITNILYGIQDMRLLFDNDIRFLKQFVL